MMNGSELLSSIWRVFFYSIVIFLILIVCSFLYRMNTVNSYTEESNEVITRAGGVTPHAQKELNDLGANTYHHMYTVSPGWDDNAKDKFSHQQRYGNEIEYRINSSIPYLSKYGFFGIPGGTLHYSSPEQVGSSVRANSQHYSN